MYPPHHLGGYELVWRSAMRHLRERGHEARVLTTELTIPDRQPDEPDTFRELRWYWRDHDLPRIGWRGRVQLERHNAAVLARHLSEQRPHVVAWWSMGGMSLSLIERVRRTGIPAVAFVHDDWLTYAPRMDRWIRPFRGHARLAALAERWTGIPARVDLEASARFVLVSETVRTHARAAGYALRESSIAHSGVDPAFLARPAPEREWGWRLLYVGRIDERKGIADAVRALAELPGQARLTVAGDGDPSVRARLERLADELRVGSRVEYLGMRPQAELPAVYGAADAVVFPVRWEEPWGLVPLEAMAVGRPVIATGRGGSGEYLRDGSNSVLFAAGDPTALARSVRRLADDGELRARLRAGGFATARAHTERAFDQAVLESLAGAAGDSGRLDDSPRNQ